MLRTEVQNYRMKQMEYTTEIEKHKKTISELDSCSEDYCVQTISEAGSCNPCGRENAFM